MLDGAEEDLEDHESRAVIEQRFALDAHWKQSREAELLEQRHDSHWIGG